MTLHMVVRSGHKQGRANWASKSRNESYFGGVWAELVPTKNVELK